MTVHELLDMKLAGHRNLGLSCIAGHKGLNREIKFSEVNRPGLALSGFFDEFGSDRIQVFGRGETKFLQQQIHHPTTIDYVRHLMKPPVPCVVFTHANHPDERIVQLADVEACPVLSTSQTTAEFTQRILRLLSDSFAPRHLVHGVHVEVFGLGVLIIGESGAGKSETALELIERGHRLVADDAVEIRSTSGGDILVAAGARAEMAHYIEIRGLGIINIPHLFGVGAVRDRKQLQLIVELEEWQPEKEYERLGDQERIRDILGVSVPFVQIPVRPGRNISIIIEVAAMNERLKHMGYNAATDLDRLVKKWMNPAQEGADDKHS